MVASRACESPLITDVRAGVAQAQLDLGIIAPSQSLALSAHSHSVASAAPHVRDGVAMPREGYHVARCSRTLNGGVHAALTARVTAEAVDVSVLAEKGRVGATHRHLPHSLRHATNASATFEAPTAHRRWRGAVSLLRDCGRHPLPDHDLPIRGEAPDCGLGAVHVSKPQARSGATEEQGSRLQVAPCTIRPSARAPHVELPSIVAHSTEARSEGELPPSAA
mmetsp:Transcript_84645/g.189131  ORF Transcript_84645/g.189131 Transcript_84645/m.189131 type:complete len:222 (+) Transcript_84645:622-1287(+)